MWHFPQKYLGLWMLVTLLVALTLFTVRTRISEPTRISFLQDQFDRSQWSIPQSQRIMGDSALYVLSGYRLATGGEHFRIAPEVPPLGKLTFGWSLHFFGSPYWASIGWYLAAIFLFHQVARSFFNRQPHKQLLALIFFAAQPLLVLHANSTLLDLPLLTTLLGFWLMTSLWLRSPNTAWLKQGCFSIGAGVFLGAFLSIKIGALALALVAALIIVLWITRRGPILLAVTLTAAISVYILTYWSFFSQGNSLLSWLQAQKWMVNFYAISDVPLGPQRVWIALIAGRYTGWWGQPGEWIREWTPLWLAGTLLLLTPMPSIVHSLWLHWKKQLPITRFSPTYLVTWLSTAFLLGLYTLIPFWPRYTLLLLPGFSLLLATHFARWSRFFQYTFLALTLSATFLALQPHSLDDIHHTNQLFQETNYEAFWQRLTPSSRPESDRALALSVRQRTSELDVRDWKLDATIERGGWWWQNSAEGTLTSTLTFDTTQVSFHRPARWEKHHNTWKLVWDNALLLPELRPESQVLAVWDWPKPGNLTYQGEVLSQAGPQAFLKLQPETLLKNTPLLENIAVLLNRQAIPLRNDLLNRAHPTLWRAVGFFPPGTPESSIQFLATQSGVLIEKIPGTLLSPKLTAEQKEVVHTATHIHPELTGKPGLSILIENQVIWSQSRQDGVDVALPEQEK